jgi:DNA polymerase I-like protein with 3'-5' exonuclease and polymerase domains/uracil-DNA glycosylase
MVAVAEQRVSLPLLRGSAEGADCMACPFSHEGQPNRPVFSEHPEKPLWILIGEGPGFNEVRFGRCFVGASGSEVDKILTKIGRPREEIYVGNATLCVDGSTNVRLGDGSLGRIDQLVKSRYSGLVQSVAADGSVVLRRVIGWYRNKRGLREMREVSTRGAQHTGGLGRIHTTMTEDHPVLTPEGWKVAGELNGGSIATGDLDPGHIGQQIAYGTLLGDGTLQRGSLIVRHAVDQAEYAMLKGQALSGIGIGLIEAPPHGNQVQRQVGFRTKAGLWGHALRSSFYPDGKKRIPKEVISNASILLFAIWYLDDGSMSHRAESGRKPRAEICGVAFPEEDLLAASASLRSLGFENRVYRGRIQFGVEASAKFSRAIARFVPPSMSYKLRPEDRDLYDPTTFQAASAIPFFAKADSVFVSPRGKREQSAVYCLEVEDTHNFITPAAVIHNCIPKPGSTDVHRNQAAAACRERMQRELSQFPGIPILTLGAVAARSVIPKEALDAIDPPDVPESKQKRQKKRQGAETDVKQKREKRLGKLELLELRIFRELLDYHKRGIADEIRQRFKKKATHAQIEERLELERARQGIEIKAKADALIELEQVEVEKAKKPKKKKPIKISDIVSTCFDVDVDGSGLRPVIPGIHPAALLRGGGRSIAGSHTPDLAFVNLMYDFGKIDALARGKDVRLKLNVEVEGQDSAKATRLFVEAIQRAFDEGEVAIDLETYVDDPLRHHALMAYVAKIRAIGLATKEKSISVLWDLIQPWGLSYFQAMLATADIKIVTQNGIYDRTVLRANGYEICGDNFEDTLYAHHSAFPGCAHNLQQITAQFFAVSPWKCLQADTAVLLPDRSTISIREAVQRRIPEVLSYEDGQIVPKRVLGWHEARAPGQAWVSIKTERSDAKYNRGLIVTPNHRVMTQRGLVEAQELIAGQDRIAIDEPQLSDDQISTAIGTLLGDSSVFVSRSYHHRPWEASRASIRGGHANEGLRDCKAESLALGTSGQCVPAHSRVSGGVTINASNFYAYGTRWAFQYMQIAKLVYDDEWKRRIKAKALEVLGRRGLAMMYMDDGDLHKTKQTIGAGFATNGFPLEDVELFVGWLKGKYGEVSIYNSRGPYVAMSTVATKNMLEDLRGFIHPSVKYKTIFDDPFKPVIKGYGAYHAAIRSVDRIDRVALRKGRSSHATDYRYCLSVEDTQLFYTNYGLVSNSEFRNAEEDTARLLAYNAKDTGATLAIRPAIEIVVKKNANERTYAIDLKMAEIASRMHRVGMPVSREVNSELLTTFSKNVAEGRQHVEAIANDPKLHEGILHHLSLEQAKIQRKADSIDFEERYNARRGKILTDEAKGKWRWKISAAKHVAALLQAIGVNLHQVTKNGSISTKKEILESLVDVPIVRDLLLFRENDKLLSTFIWQIFDRTVDGNIIQHGFADANDRIHPIWNVHKISGRWASYEPVVSNVPKAKYKKLEGGKLKLVRPNLRRQVQVTRKGRKLVGFDFCLAKGTLVDTPNGHTPIEKLKIGDLVFSYNHETQRPDCSRVSQRLFTGMQKTLKVILDNGEEVRCTANHRWLTRKYGSGRAVFEVEASDLKPGMRLLPLRRTYSGPERSYEILYSYSAFEYVKTHVVVAKAHLGDRPKGHDIHHRNENPKDNRPRNLEYKLEHDHLGEHSASNTSAQWKDPATRQKMVEGISASIKARGGYHGANNPNFGKRTGEDGTCPNCGADTYFGGKHPKRFCSKPCFYEFRRTNPRRRGEKYDDLNHKVVAVIDDGLVVPTYDIEVERDHNFALAAGVFVHNSQLEARNLALISGDEFLCKIFAEGRDIHTECARVIFKGFDQREEKERKQLRDLTKQIEYGTFYGGSPETCWKVLLKDGHNVKLVDVAASIGTLMRQMPGIVRWQRQTVAKASLPPFTIRDFVLGRRRVFPMGQVDPNEALNFESQATAAAIMDTGMAAMDARIIDQGYKEVDCIVQVHDAAVYEAWEDDAEDIAQDIHECFSQQYERDGRTIPYPVDVKIGDSWDQM